MHSLSVLTCNYIRVALSEAIKANIKKDLIFEGFGGKRALGFLLKSELCQKRSKFRMQFCLGALNNVLYVFSLKFASFSRYYVCKKTCICCHVSA